MCNQAQQEKGTFQRLYKDDSAQQWLKKGSVIWLNGHKERTSKFVPPPYFKRGDQRPPHFKNCSADPGQAHDSAVSLTMF